MLDPLPRQKEEKKHEHDAHPRNHPRVAFPRHIVDVDDLLLLVPVHAIERDEHGRADHNRHAGGGELAQCGRLVGKRGDEGLQDRPRVRQCDEVEEGRPSPRQASRPLVDSAHLAIRYEGPPALMPRWIGQQIDARDARAVSACRYGRSAPTAAEAAAVAAAAAATVAAERSRGHETHHRPVEAHVACDFEVIAGGAKVRLELARRDGDTASAESAQAGRGRG